MSEAAARAFLEGLARFGDERARQVALEALSVWDSVSDAARRMRESRARRQPEATARSDVADAKPLRSVTSDGRNGNATERNVERDGNATESPKAPSLSLDLLKHSGSERESCVQPVASVTLRSPRVKHRYPETVAPDPNDAPAFLAFCATWGLEAKDPVVVACIGHHYAKGSKWRDWRWTVRNWRSREKATGTNGRYWVQPAGGHWKSGESERKAEEIP